MDGCFTPAFPPQFIAETQTLASTGAPGTCNALYPSWTYPRAQAGAAVAADKLKGQLKPVAAGDYPVSFSTAELARLNAAFPGGVCDWSKAGVGQTATVAYSSFGPSLVNLIFSLFKP